VINGDKAAKERYQEIETDFLNQFLPEEDFGNAMGFYEIQIDNLYGNREDYKFLQKVKASDIIKDEYLKREISMLYNYYLHYQMSPKLNEVITEKHSAMVKQFRNYAFPIWGDTLSQIYAMRKRRGLFDVDSIKEISYGICAIGDTIMPGFKQLIKYRNKMARSLGYKNYYELELESSDQNPATIQKLIDTLEILTREPYRDWMGKAKNKLSEIYHIPEDSVSYWHFYGSSVRGMRDPYPEMDSVDYLARTVSFFRGINIPVDSIVDRSIISFSPKNNNHYSFFMPFDNNKDGRVYVNTENSFVSLYYMFHELGHAVHDEYVDESIPYLLRDFNLGLTEGVAMFFDGLLDEPRFLYEMGFIDSAVLEKRLKSYAQYKRKAEI
jgi:peptidyl-dipeptidase A